MSYDGKGQAAELPFRFEGEPEFEGGEVAGSYFLGYAKELKEAFDAAVNLANKKPGTRFVVTQIEVVSEADPHVGGYKVILSPSG
jgi:hypothetical protein